MAVDSSSAHSGKGSASAGPFSFGSGFSAGASARASASGGVRFAPSPTGRFHLGNLRTAWISWKLAHTLGWPWVVRFEDIDAPRVLAGARDLQLADMAALGLVPTVELLQSDFHARHLELFSLARSVGAVYACNCSRREVQQALSGLASAPHDGVAPVYSGHCRTHAADPEAHVGAGGLAWRFKMPDESGRSDFIVARTVSGEFTPGYHWACAIDDFDGAYEWIVRSADLASALPLQQAIQNWIARATGAPPCLSRVFHTALITQDDGHRLEKRTQGVTLPELEARGWSASAILRQFEISFDSQLMSTLANGESRAELTLLELGFS